LVEPVEPIDLIAGQLIQLGHLVEKPQTRAFF
jgi:hypothetical protein